MSKRLFAKRSKRDKSAGNKNFEIEAARREVIIGKLTGKLLNKDGIAEVALKTAPNGKPDR